MQRLTRKVIKAKPTTEGAGVHLLRVFGFEDTSSFDPFLLFDHFGSTNPQDYQGGFPWHPHRGIETITYLLKGEVEHQDSLGNKGVLGPGDIQWMTAGSGIIHQEMPRRDPSGAMMGFQLWANLPSSHKMMNPRYQEIRAAAIPEIPAGAGAKVKVIAGSVGATRGPVHDIVINPELLDVTVAPNSGFTHPTTPGHTVFAYAFEGSAFFDGERQALVSREHMVLFHDGDHIAVATGDEPVRFIFASGIPVREPVAWYGPIVMNTQEELKTALDEFKRGTFVKHAQPS